MLPFITTWMIMRESPSRCIFEAPSFLPSLIVVSVADASATLFIPTSSFFTQKSKTFYFQSRTIKPAPDGLGFPLETPSKLNFHHPSIGFSQATSTGPFETGLTQLSPLMGLPVLFYFPSFFEISRIVIQACLLCQAQSLIVILYFPHLVDFLGTHFYHSS